MQLENVHESNVAFLFKVLSWNRELGAVTVDMRICGGSLLNNCAQNFTLIIFPFPKGAGGGG